MLLSLIIPCFDEEENVLPFFSLVKGTFKNLKYDYEFVFINDGSKDDTLKQLKKLYNENDKEKITIVNLSRNFGKEAAMYAGLQKSKGDYVTIIDADLQQNPKYVVEMLEILEKNEDLDCVAAFQEERKEGKGISFFKKMFYKIISKITKIEFATGASDFRTMNRKMVDALLSMPEYFRFSKGLFAWVGFETEFIPYEVEERRAGETKWTFWKLMKYAFDGIISFTTAPLKIATTLGLLIAFIAVVYTIIVIIQRIAFGIDVPGYASLLIVTLVLGGAQLFTIGILGEYLARAFTQGKNRPIYIAKDVFTYDEDENAENKED